MLRLRNIWLLFILTIPIGLVSQSIDTRFGKNRVQYHDDFRTWDKYETENFIVHWYGKARNVARTVIPIAELYHDEVQNILEHRMNDKIKILVYTDISDLNQSNIGNDETWTSKAGETKIVGNKMFVYFDGNHQHLETQIREGIASVYLASMLFGSSFQEFVQNAVLLNLPQWYKEGIISYAGDNWNKFIEDELRDLLNRDEDYYDFDDLADDHPRAAGHSLWYFISQTYGASTIPNILYLTKISRDMEESFIYVLSEKFETIKEEWSAFYKDYYRVENGRYSSPEPSTVLDLKNKSYVPISLLEFSPDGSKLAYNYNNIGQYRLVIKDLNTGDEQTVFKHGYKNNIQAPDYNYPVMTWHPDGNTITIAYEDRDKIYIEKINLRTEEKINQLIPEEFQRIYSISYLDEEHYVFSANTDGFSDLYVYDTKFRTQERLTDDFYDELDARVVNLYGKQGILFSSNRTIDYIQPIDLDTILPLDKFDLFFYDFENEEEVERLTNTENYNERYPVIAGDGHIAFLSGRNGMINAYALDILSGRSYPVTNLDRNIIRHGASTIDDMYIYTLYRNGAYKIFMKEMDWTSRVNLSSTPFALTQKDNQVLIPLINEEEEKLDTLKPGYLFQSTFDDPDYVPDIMEVQEEENQLTSFLDLIEENETPESSIVQFKSPRVTAARTTFRLDNFTTKLNNEVLFEGLETYAGDPQSLDYNPNGLLLKATIKDLLENYSLEGGVRIPTTFDGTEYFLVFDDKRKLIDRRYAIYRKTNTDFVNEMVFPPKKTKKSALIGLFQLKYPFDVYRSIRATTTLRFDRVYQQVVDNPTLNDPFINEKRLGLKLEYVYDNTIDIDENIRHGTRYKFYVEGINRFNFELVDGFNVDPSVAYTGIIGFDFRHYIPFLKYSIIALRGAGAASMGSEKIMYYLGGTNGWVFQKFNETTPVPDDPSFAYKTAATQMRGFNFNVRNGASYALINAELRLPLFKYMMGRNIKSSFLRNFQVVGFYDVGSAWHGLSPYSDENPINTQTFISPPVITVNVNYFRDPLVMGYGAGLRSKVLGYFIKLDYAWGVETRRVNDGIFYFSLGTDF